MGAIRIRRRIQYQEELHPEFGRQVAAQPGGEDLLRCIQCGTCSGTCPVSIYMDHTPRQIVAMTRAGMRDEVLSSNTIWICASCYACTVDCPRQIHITDVMYRLKQRALAEGRHPRRLPVPVLARSASGDVRRHGRMSEFRVASRTFLESDPLKLFGYAGLGLGLFLRGRMPLSSKSMGPGRDGVARLLDHVGRAAGNGGR